MRELPVSATAERVCGILEELGISYALCGALAAIYYGEARLTQDVDVAVEIEPDAVPALLDRLDSLFYVDREAALRAIRNRDMFQALDMETFVKVDFHPGECVQGELARAVARPVFSEAALRLLSKEDAILSKLWWISLGSGKSRQDVVAMLLDPQPLDEVFVRATARSMGTETLLNELLAEAARLAAD